MIELAQLEAEMRKFASECYGMYADATGDRATNWADRLAALRAALAQEPTRAMNFRQFSVMNRTRCESPQGFNHPLHGWSTSDWFVAIVGELGEAANVVKKLNRVRDGVPGNKQTPDELREKLRQELGDAFVYLDLIAQSLGFNIGDAAVEVFDAKSKEIGYTGDSPAPDPPHCGQMVPTGTGSTVCRRPTGHEGPHSAVSTTSLELGFYVEPDPPQEPRQYVMRPEDDPDGGR